MEDSESSTGKTGLWQRIFDLFFGYNYFIAHRSVDGKPYAAALYDSLTTEGKELDCFLDVKHYDAGGRPPWMQSRAHLFRLSRGCSLMNDLAVLEQRVRPAPEPMK